ncbi:MAG: carboxylate-amine ligase [Proteobacteria bacterium]|nr:carboxylate-amine ligase [Pseudomonadota bacterium]
MADSGAPLTIGIEEEYLLIDPETRDLAIDPPHAILDACGAMIGTEDSAVTPEFLRTQIEVATPVCHSIREARARIAYLRGCVATAAAEYGLRPIAASTHPFAEWSLQQHTDGARYNVLTEDMQQVAQRLLICGMHVHIGIEDANIRNDMLNQVSYFLPHLLALTTSSPFWQGRLTGLMCYRLSVFDELPRTGLPERFDSHAEYIRHVDALIEAGLIEDASKIWWDIRAHSKFPTLEMRIADICTRMDDGITVAALYACLISMLMRLRRHNQRWRIYSNMLVQENRWRAQRYGIDRGLVDFGQGRIVAYAELLDEILDLVREDAERLDCVAEVENARNIVARGTSAHGQIIRFREAKAAGATETEALRAVVDWLAAETQHGVSPAGAGNRGDQTPN